MKLISQINKASAWVLMACFLAYVVSGFDIQLRFLAPQVTSFLHLKYLFIPAMAAFAFHTSYAICLALKRRNFWNIVGKGVLILYILLNLVLLGVYFNIYLF